MRNFQQPANNIKSNVGDAAIQITCNSKAITAETIDGVTYYTTERRGVIYTANQTAGGNWWVSSHRKALGRMHIGGGRYYESLDALAAGCKAFAGLPILLSLAGLSEDQAAA